VKEAGFDWRGTHRLEVVPSANDAGNFFELRTAYPVCSTDFLCECSLRKRTKPSGGVGVGFRESGGRVMVVVRFKVQCQPEKAEQAMTAFQKVVAASRRLDGVISFDIGRDIADPNSFIATEVFDDRTALDRQESLPVVEETVGLLEQLLAAEPEATIFHVSSSEPWGD
jgi:quinol monooxygenase YgiN